MSRISDWKNEIYNHKHLIFFSLIFLAVALVLNYTAGAYVSRISSVSASDAILDSIPTIDLDFLFIYGEAFIIFVLFAYPLFFRVRDLHRVISQFSLLVLVRSGFICFTHLKVPASALQFSQPYFMSLLNFQNDLFFSAHTALSFLGFLLFKGEKIRYFFLIASIIMGCVVLLMHVHYTIDVLSAFFITYGTFEIGKWLFGKLDTPKA